MLDEFVYVPRKTDSRLTPETPRRSVKFKVNKDTATTCLSGRFLP